MSTGKTLEERAPFGGQDHQYRTAVRRRMATHDKAGQRKPVNELNRAMVLQQHLLGEFPDHDCSRRVSLNCQQRLVLRRCDFRRPRNSFAESEKPSQG
jgi:hypothetical protein